MEQATIQDKSKHKDSSSNGKLIERNKSKSLTIYNFIVSIITILILFLQSIYILLSCFRRGFFKKEVLTTKSNLGFDIIIKN